MFQASQVSGEPTLDQIRSSIRGASAQVFRQLAFKKLSEVFASLKPFENESRVPELNARFHRELEGEFARTFSSKSLFSIAAKNYFIGILNQDRTRVDAAAIALAFTDPEYFDLARKVLSRNSRKGLEKIFQVFDDTYAATHSALDHVQVPFTGSYLETYLRTGTKESAPQFNAYRRELFARSRKDDLGTRSYKIVAAINGDRIDEAATDFEFLSRRQSGWNSLEYNFMDYLDRMNQIVQDRAFRRYSGSGQNDSMDTGVEFEFRQVLARALHRKAAKTYVAKRPVLSISCLASSEPKCTTKWENLQANDRERYLNEAAGMLRTLVFGNGAERAKMLEAIKDLSKFLRVREGQGKI